MDENAEPCKDFYQFACGNYNKHFPLSPDKASIDNFDQVHTRLTKEIKDLVEEPMRADDSQSTKLAKTHYQACSNVAELESLGLSPLLDVIASLGGWPTLEGGNWTGDSYECMQMEAKIFHDSGGSTYFKFGVHVDVNNSNVYKLYLDQGNLGLENREYYLQEKYADVLDAYRKYIVSTAIQLGADNDTAIQDAGDVITLETRLANITIRSEDRRNYSSLYQTMSLKDIKGHYSQIPFNTFFDLLALYGWKIDDSMDIDVAAQIYLSSLAHIIQTTSKRTLANLQVVNVVTQLVSYLAPSLRGNRMKYMTAMSGVQKDKPRWEECVETARSALSQIIGSMYVRKFFKADDKEKVVDMVRNINASMWANIRDARWMDNETRTEALNKLSNEIMNVGYPDYIFNESKLLQDMEDEQFSAKTFMKNAVNLRKKNFRNLKRLLYEVANRTDWTMSPARADAVNSLQYNSITFPAGIMQYPFFSAEAPAYFNYARFGSIIGHEITHGYDDRGRQFDGHGNVRVWWSDSTAQAFTVGQQCFIEQYGNITDNATGLQLNGVNTIGENIADNGGMKLAYRAYKLWSVNNEETVLRNLEKYTMDQLYFILYAQGWCDNSREESIEDEIMSDPHSPRKYRATLPLVNFDAFSKAFDCPIGSPMNPTKKCSVW